jgi:putative ABC transport system permease protein
MVEALPGVRSGAIVTNHPLDRGFTNSFLIEGEEYDPEQGEITTRLVTPGYFETVGLRLVEGRLPRASDGPGDPHVIVLNRKAAERYFPHGGAIGSRLSFWGQYREVIGIVDNERMHGLVEEVPPALYVNLLQTPPVASKITLMVSTEIPPLDMVDGVRGTIWAMDRDLAVFNVSTMDDTLADASARERFASVILFIFACVAVFLALLGVHGILSYLLAQRRHEVGVRMALGATRGDVVRGIVGQGARMALPGLAGGLLGAVLLSGFLRGILFGVSPTAPRVYAVVGAGLALVSLAATIIPSWRAASVSPADSLRGE